MSTPLEFKNVNKAFGSKSVLTDVNFAVRPGELCVLLGPNGAGKSTAMALATGLESPDQGAVEIFGHKGGSLSARRAVAFVPQESTFPGASTGREILNFVAAHYPTSAKVENLCRTFQVDGFWDSPVRQLSGGQRRRLALAAAFLTQAPLIILDEPTTGLDHEARHQVFQQFKEYNQSGGTIFMTTHYLAEAEELAQRILVLNRGRIVRTGSPGEIKRQYGFKRVRFQTTGSPPFSSAQKSGDGHWWIDTQSPDATLKQVVEWNQATDIEVTPLSLEQVFTQLIEEKSP
jgi:ABC-2 type transport system ATP-binding protein